MTFPNKTAPNKTRQLSSSTVQKSHTMITWALGITILIAFALIDTAAVAIPAMALSIPQIAAFGIAFLLIAAGALFTIWRFE